MLTPNHRFVTCGFYFAGSMTMLTPNHRFVICGGPYVFIFTIIFYYCGVKTNQGGHERYIL